MLRPFLLVGAVGLVTIAACGGAEATSILDPGTSSSGSSSSSSSSGSNSNGNSDRGPADASTDAKTDAADPPTGTFKCGDSSTKCSASQYCVIPCCGGPAPFCEPKPASGQCPPGTHPGACPTSGAEGCVQDPCKPDPPFCIDDDKKSPVGCQKDGKTRTLACQCA